MDKTVATLKFKKFFGEGLLKFFSKNIEDTESFEKRKLLSDIEEALSDLRLAKNCFEDAKDPEMIEACVYEIKSAEARYNFLLRKAKLMTLKNPDSPLVPTK